MVKNIDESKSYNATNIQWDIDDEDVIDALQEADFKAVAESLGVDPDLSETKKRSNLLSIWHETPERLYEYLYGYFDLPASVQIPSELIPEGGTIDDDVCEEIGDWLSNTYGYCHKGFDIAVSEAEEDQQNPSSGQRM